MQECARALHGNSKNRGDTPDEHIYLIKEDYEEELQLYNGGVLNKISESVNQFLFENNEKLQLSKSTIFSMFPDAKLKFAKSQNTMTQPKIDQHYCAATIKISRTIHQLFGNEIIYLSIDQKSLIKVETGKNLKGKCIQLIPEMKRVHCHDAGHDVLGKIAMNGIEIQKQDPTLINLNSNYPINIYENMIPGWNLDTHTKLTEGLAIEYVHNHSENPETSARNASDICELFETFIPYVITKDNKLKSALFIIMDNHNGPSTEKTRFVAVLLFLKYDFDIVVIVCNAGGYSKLNPVEKVHGCVSHPLNK